MLTTQGCYLRNHIGLLTYAMCAASTCCSTSAIPKHRNRPSATWVGSLRPASHMACFQASIARCRLYSVKSASVSLGSSHCHAVSKVARAACSSWLSYTTWAEASARKEISKKRGHANRAAPLPVNFK